MTFCGHVDAAEKVRGDFVHRNPFASSDGTIVEDQATFEVHPALIVAQVFQDVVRKMIVTDFRLRRVRFSSSCLQHLHSAVGKDSVTVGRDIGPMDLQPGRVGGTGDPFQLVGDKLEIGRELLRGRVLVRDVGKLVFGMKRQSEPVRVVLEFRLVLVRGTWQVGNLARGSC
jgi:hypothetical protein